MLRCALSSVLLLLLFSAGPALAFDRSDGEQVQCRFSVDGVTHVAEEEVIGDGNIGERHPSLGGSAAVVRKRPDGMPKIVFDRFVMARIAQRSALASDLVFYHECAHIHLASDDEILANCQAVRDMRSAGYLDDAGEIALAEWHRNMGRVPPRYGGTGELFWARTVDCLNDTPPALVSGAPLPGP